MKNTVKNGIICLSILLFSFFGCTEKNKITPEEPRISVLEQEFSRISDYYDIEIPGNEDWQVTYSPTWTTPVSMDGTSGTALSIYVQNNIHDADRTDSLKISLANGDMVKYNLVQVGKLGDDDNSIVINTNTLKRSYGIGYGVDVLAPTNIGKYNIKNSPVDRQRIINVLKSIGEEDAFVQEKRFFSQSESYVGSSATSISTQLSVNAGIEAEVSGFKASLKGSFKNTETTNEKTGYAIKSIKHIVASCYLRGGILRYLSSYDESILDDGFKEKIKEIAKSRSVEDVKTLVSDFGTHVITYGELGGEIQLALEMKSTEVLKESDIHAAIDVTAKVVNVSGDFDMNNESKNFSEQSKMSFRSYGGNNAAKTVLPGTSYIDAIKTILGDKAKLDKWVAGLKGDNPTLALIDMQAIPIYDLISDESVRQLVRDYIIGDYQVAINGHKSLMFAVNGFADPNTISGTLNIPEIDVSLEYYCEKVPEITGVGSDELSTIIYSGNSYGMNYDCGFFIGSDTNKPGKLRKDRQGNFTYEPFESLATVAVSEVYVDASGDVTIASKTTDAYMERKFVTMSRDLLGNKISSKGLANPGSGDILLDIYSMSYNPVWTIGCRNSNNFGNYCTIASRSSMLSWDSVNNDSIEMNFKASPTFIVRNALFEFYGKTKDEQYNNVYPFLGDKIFKDLDRGYNNIIDFSFKIPKDTKYVLVLLNSNIMMGADNDVRPFEKYYKEHGLWRENGEPQLTFVLDDTPTPRWR